MARAKDILQATPHNSQEKRTQENIRIRRRSANIQGIGATGGLAGVGIAALALAPIPVIGEFALVGAAGVGAAVAADALWQKWKLHLELRKAEDLQHLADQQGQKIKKRADKNGGRHLPSTNPNKDGSVDLLQNEPIGVVDRRWLPAVPVIWRRAMITPIDPNTHLPTGDPDVVERSWGGRKHAVRIAANKQPFGTGSLVMDNERVIGAATPKITKLALRRYVGNPIMKHRVVLVSEVPGGQKSWDATWILFSKGKNYYEVAAQRVKVGVDGKPKLSRFQSLKYRS